MQLEVPTPKPRPQDPPVNGKNTQPKVQTPEIGFEPEDKPTPLAGKFLLILMAALLIFLGIQGLRDIENIPNKPEQISRCANKVTYYYDEYTRKCEFSKYEVKYDVPALFTQANAIGQAKEQLNKQKTTFSTQLNNLNLQIGDNQKLYDLSLQETIAEEDRVGSTPEENRAQLQTQEQRRTDLNQKILTLSTQISSKQSDLDIANNALTKAVEKAKGDFKKDNAVYKLWVFVIQTLFVFPIFFFFLKLYLSLKKKDSPHTIIATTLLGVSGIFVLYITIIYLWTAFLGSLLEIIGKFVFDTPLFRTLLFYFGMILVIVIFGGAVFLLQKKVFNPARVRLRRLRAHKCPYCEFPFDFSKYYCPSCGKQLMANCASCGKEKYTDMKHCPNCGKTST